MENDHSVVMNMRTFYLKISPHLSHITGDQVRLFQVECWGVIRSVVTRGFMVTRRSLCGRSMETLWSSVDMGFRPILGKVGEEAVDLLPHAWAHASLSLSSSGS